MDDRHLRLDCVIIRWNKPIPAAFIIDTKSKSLQTAVYDKRTYSSLDNKKGQGPRPLKTLAYNFSHIEDESGNTIINQRAADSESAKGFVDNICEKAVPISREEYLDELERIRWPSVDTQTQKLMKQLIDKEVIEKDTEFFRSPTSYHKAEIRPLKFDVGESMLSEENRVMAEMQFLGRIDENKDQTHPDDISNEQKEDIRMLRKRLILELVNLIEEMDIEEIESIVKYARLLNPEE